MHGALGAKPDDLARHRGRYDGGWDRLLEERSAQQLAAGVFPPATKPAPRNPEPGPDVPAWDSLGSEKQQRHARLMDVYAAMVDNVDPRAVHARLESVDDTPGRPVPYPVAATQRVRQVAEAMQD